MIQKIFLSLFLFYSPFIKISVKSTSSDFNSALLEKPSIEIRGVFYPCIRGFQRFEKDGQEKNYQFAMECSTKIYINMRITNSGPKKYKDQFIILDHVHDPLINASSHLLNPIVFKVSQEQILEVYDLKFLKLLNGIVKEAIHEQSLQARKCEHSAHLPCGSHYSKMHHQSHNHGLCCSCDSSLSQNSKHHKIHHRQFGHLQRDALPLNKNEGKNQYYSSNAKQLKKREFSILPEIPHVSPMATIPSEYFQSFSQKHGHIFDETPFVDDNNPVKNHIHETWTGDLVQINNKQSISSADIKPLAKHDTNDQPINTLENSMISGEIRVDGHHAIISSVNDHKNDTFSEEGILPSDKKHSENAWNIAEGISNHATYRDESDGESFNPEVKEESLPSTGFQGMNKNGKELYERMNDDISDNARRVNHVPIEISNVEKVSQLSIGLPIDINVDYEPQKPNEDMRNDFDSSHPNSGREPTKRLKEKGNKHTGCAQGEKVTIHCLSFSDLWYAVYRMANHSYRHVINLQIFEKYHNSDGSKLWIDHTDGKIISLGSLDEQSKGQAFGDNFKYKVLEKQNEQKSIDPKVHMLLVPQPVPAAKMTAYPEANGNPAEFLVLNEDLITLDGSECDKAGVGFEAFISKKGRCTARQGTCLGNQPATLWRQDKEAKIHGRKGHYFLENFGHVTRDSFQENNINGEQSLTFEFYGKHVSQVDVAVPGDYNYIVHKGVPAQITAIVVDANRQGPPSFTVSVTNLGLASDLFMAQIGRCSPPLRSRYNLTGFVESSFRSLNSKKLMISSLHQADFVVDLYQDINVDKMFCIVKVLNDNSEIVATRRAAIQRGGRCICIWHCQCNCIKSIIKLKCKLLPLSEIHAAGLKGAIPVLLPTAPVGYMVIFQEKNDLYGIYFFLIGILLVLLLLGCNKALLGLTFWKSIWIWGLPYYFGPISIHKYREPELAGRKVQYDKNGYPIHPDTKKRTVQLYNRWVEFFLNIIIFLVFPLLALIWWPICWCYSLCFKNFIGFRWRFSASKQNAESESATFDPEDPEDERKSNGDTHSSVEGKNGYRSESSTDTSSKASDNPSRGSLNKSRSNKESRDGNSFKKSQSSESKSQQSIGNTQMAEFGSNASIISQNSESAGHASEFASHMSIETYDGIADEQEINDVEYVLKQLRRSSTEIQKSREKLFGGRGNKTPNEGIRMSRRGEILQEGDSSAGLESSSEDSISVNPIGIKNMEDVGDENEGRVFKSSAGVRAPSSKPTSARDGQADTYSEVTTKDSLEYTSEDESKRKSLSSAQKLVQRLHSKRVIFRNLVKPIGDVSFPTGQPYSIRGYFLKTNGGYKFIPPTPLWQYWTLDEDGINMTSVEPPKNLISGDFEKDYSDAQCVADAGDLSELPLSSCINVQFQNFDMNNSIEEMVK